MNYLLEIGSTIHQSWVIFLSLVLCGVLILFIILSRLKARFKFCKKPQLRLEDSLKTIKTSSENTLQKNAKGFLSNLPLAKTYQLSGFKQKFELYILFLFFCALFFGVLFWKASNGFWGSIGFVIIFIFGVLLTYLKASDQKKKLIVQIPIFLRALSNTMQAGYTLEQSFAFIAQEMDNPLKKEVLRIHQNLQLQIPLENVLQDFSENIENSEVDFFVESTLIQLKTGGNLIILFEKIAYMIEEKIKLQRDIKSFTSQGKLSGILIAILWPLSLAAFSWISPQHTEVLFNTTMGQAMLGVSILLELIGFFFIWKIITIKI